MIAQLADLFVDRRPRPSGARVIAARRVLVVDAGDAPARLTPLIDALEARSAVRVAIVASARLDLVPANDVFDAVWLVVGPEIDHAYGELLAQELAGRFRAPTRVVAIGAPARGDWLALDRHALGGAPPWRRRRSLDAAVVLLAGVLESGRLVEPA